MATKKHNIVMIYVDNHPGHSVDFFTDKAVEYIDQCSGKRKSHFSSFLPIQHHLDTGLQFKVNL